MAFVRKRPNKTGSVSTALVEAYRDQAGKPRQRILANLHGAETTLEALARLAAQRQELRNEKAELDSEVKHAQQFYEKVMGSAALGHRYTATERKDIDRLLRARKKLLKRSGKVDTLLAQISREGAIIKKHCEALPEQIQAAIRAFQKKLKETQALVAGSEFFLYKAKQDLRRLSLDPKPVEFDKKLAQALSRQ